MSISTQMHEANFNLQVWQFQRAQIFSFLNIIIKKNIKKKTLVYKRTPSSLFGR